MERMPIDVGPHGKRAWDLLDDVAAERLSLGELFDAWRSGDLAGLRARRADVDLSEEIPGWLAWLRDRTTADTREQTWRISARSSPKVGPYGVPNSSPCGGQVAGQ
jgi:hypothetical protein